jgi:signal peptidase II
VTIAPRWRWFVVVTVLTAIADQLTKAWALGALTIGANGRAVAVPVIDGLWDWRLSFNTGSAFGLFHGATGARIFLSVVALAALAAMAWMVRQTRDDRRLALAALGLVAGGAIGNLVDRVLVGKVTDFVVWKLKGHEWPAFNVADVALCVGVGLLLLDGGGEKPPAKRP